MNQIFTKPYKSIWLSIPCLLGLSLLGMNCALDLQTYDSYFVIGTLHVGVAFAIVLGLLGGIYWLVRKRTLILWMTALHIVTTVLILCIVLITSILFDQVRDANFDTFSIVNQSMLLAILILVCVQFVFAINLVISFLRNKGRGI